MITVFRESVKRENVVLLKDIDAGFFTGSIGAYKDCLFLCVEYVHDKHDPFNDDRIKIAYLVQGGAHSDYTPFKWQNVWTMDNAPFSNYTPVDTQLYVMGASADRGSDD